MEERQKILVGQVTGVHGKEGELKVKVLTDFPERFSVHSKMELGWKDDEKKDRLVLIESSRPHKGHLLVKVKGIETREDAKELMGAFFQINKEEVRPLPNDSFYHFQIVGLKVYYLEGGFIGTVSQILHTPNHDVYVVQGEKEILIPALKKVIKKVDLEARRMWIDREMITGFED
ncbi:MAG: ribosome maturation factor RimM [Candidatus Eremiobacteraeota bacterium]|nr:ribosome maturation factor RimM [Candidatus Eremiobacteraeota bacterium]